MTITSDDTITPETPDEICAYGRLTAERAVSRHWAPSVRAAGAVLSADLLDAVETFEAIRDGHIHPASEYDDLRDHPEAEYAALVKTAEAITELADELIRVFPGCAVVAEKEMAA